MIVTKSSFGLTLAVTLAIGTAALSACAPVPVTQTTTTERVTTSPMMPPPMATTTTTETQTHRPY